MGTWMKLPSKLADRIAKEFRAEGLHVYPIAKRIEEIVSTAGRVDLKRMLSSLVVAFTLGFGLCFAWVGIQLSVINGTLAAWKQEYDAEHKKHHAAELKPLTAQAARAIAGKLEKETANERR